MKTTFLKHKFLYFFILLGLTVSFNGCSSDEDTITFLEKYEGTKWSYNGKNINNIDFSSYYRLNNTIDKFMEYWYTDENIDCHQYSYTIFKIIENSGDKLVVSTTLEDNESLTQTLTIQGEILKIVFEKKGSENDIFYFNKTSMNFDELKICR